jgi:hypothetical protein
MLLLIINLTFIKVDEYPTDIALWPTAVTDSMREYWVKKGSEFADIKTRVLKHLKLQMEIGKHDIARRHF